VVIFFTEMFRDREGRGAVLHGALDYPQIAAVVTVLAGALLLRERAAIAVGRDAEVPHA
jgi:phosphatidylglycerol:prolipoprotein diacylglycerol transferase